MINDTPLSARFSPAGAVPRAYANIPAPNAASPARDTMTRSERAAFMRVWRKLGHVARRVKHDYRLRHEGHDRVLRRLKLRTSGHRSGGRDSRRVSPRGSETHPILRRRLRGGGG